MAAFWQQHPGVVEKYVLSPNSTLTNYGFLDEIFPNWSQFYPNSPGNNMERSSIDASNQESSCLEQQSVSNGKQGTGQSLLSMADKPETCSTVRRKRKSRNGVSINSSYSKELKQGKDRKKQKGAKKGEKKDKDKNKGNADQDEPPKGYIHVRARRGQATDSHSLAERVRREKISERMKMLQALVPGCDKVTGKTLVLDEIINYVQSLQNQVEFLSMRLAFLDPMGYDFRLTDLDPIMPFETQELINISTMELPLPPLQSSPATASLNTTLPINFGVSSAMSTSATTGATTAPPSSLVAGGIAQPPAYVNANTVTPVVVVDSSANFFLRDQKPNDCRSIYLESRVDEHQQQSFFNQLDFDSNN